MIRKGITYPISAVNRRIPNVITLAKVVSENTNQVKLDDGSLKDIVVSKNYNIVTIATTEDNAIVDGVDPVVENFELYFQQGEAEELYKLKTIKQLAITAYKYEIIASAYVEFGKYKQMIDRDHMTDMNNKTTIMKTQGLTESAWTFSNGVCSSVTLDEFIDIAIQADAKHSVYATKEYISCMLVDALGSAEEVNAFDIEATWELV
jgi:hypothetical protein